MKVSILVVSYNHEKYIRQALDGVLMQRNIGQSEIILCDDCSTDQTVVIATQVLAGLPNVQVHTNERNLGITRNYQQAFIRCAGEFIAIVEGDDYWTDPFKLARQISFLENNPFCAMCAHPFIVQQAQTRIFTFPISPATDYTLFDGKDLIMDEGIISNFSTCCYRKDMLCRISPKTYETISYEWMINISIAEFGFLARINTPMSVYRHSDSGSWTNLTYEKQLKGMIDIIPEYDEILEQRYHTYFMQKVAILKGKLATFLRGRSKSARHFIPPFIYPLARWIVPPVFRR